MRRSAAATVTSFDPWPRARSKRPCERPRRPAQRASAVARDASTTALAATRPPRWRPMTSACSPKRSASPTVCAKSRAVTSTSAPRARSTSTTGRITRTCGLFVRSTQTRTGRGAWAFGGRVVATLGRLVLGILLPLASVTDPLVRFATNVVGDLGLAGVFVLMLLESACIPIPSEATMLFAGFNVAEGHYSLIAVTLVGTFANLVGSWIAYAVGYYGRIDILEKHGRKLHIKPSHLEWADRWFQRHGDATVFFTRMLPVIRTFISLPAGVARMPFWRFTAFTLLGCIPWVFLLTFIGKQAGANWKDWKDGFHYVDYAVIAMVVVGLVWLFIRARRRRNAAAA